MNKSSVNHYVVVKDKKQLGKLIANEIEKNGPCCNLNFLAVSNIKDMSGLFESSPFNGDISRWDVSNVTNMDWMFEDSQFNGDISQWDVSSVSSRRWMFCDSEFRGDLRPWNLSEKELKSAFEEDLSDYLGHRLSIEEREKLIELHGALIQKKSSRVL